MRPLALLALLAPCAAGAMPFDADRAASTKNTFETEAPKYRRDRDIDVGRIIVEIEPDLQKQVFKASVTHKFKVLAAELPELSLDARGLDVEKVVDGSGRALPFELVEGKLKIRFPKPLSAGDGGSVRVSYGGAPDFEGLYFFKPDPRYPEQPLALWSQGQPETNSHWIPMYDYPNQRAASEMIVTIPSDLVAVSNGKLASKEPGPKPGTTRWHWVQERPHVGYLIALYVGKLAKVEDKPAPVGPADAKQSIPVAYWVQPGREDEARLTFGKTPAMVSFFSDWLAQPFAWDRYDQVVNYESGGGMENTTATNIGDFNLRDKRAMLVWDSDGLIAHELAHQWFGDLITCKDWSHIWLNEAFATFFQMLWTQHDKGDDEYYWDLHENAKRYFGEAESYKRPIVSERYAHPWDVFDAHTYLKGSWVLHMLRRELGDQRFQASLRRYMAHEHDRVADTEDLRRSFEDTTGKALAEFFEQWVYGAGHPELKLKLAYDSRERKLALELKQKQAKDGKGAFHFKLPLRLSDGKTVTADVTQAEQSFSWDVSSRPKWVTVDPESRVLAAYDLEWPQDMLLAELASGPAVMGRARAAETLGKNATPKVVAALGACLKDDPFWGVAATCAQTLSKAGGTPALEALRAGAAHKNPKVRSAVAEALASFVRRPEALEALKALAEDEAWSIQGSALRALGALRLPEARPILEAKLKADSWNDVVRGAALEGLGALRDETAAPVLKQWMGPGLTRLARQGAFNGWAKLGETKDVSWETLTDVLETETDPYLTRAAVNALKTLGDPRAVPELLRIQARAPSRRIHDAAGDAVEALREGRKGKIEELSTLVDGLQKKVDRLEKRLEDAEKLKR